MRLCRIKGWGEESTLAFFDDDQVMPLSVLHELYNNLGYGASPLFPPPANDPFNYLPPRWESYEYLQLLAQLSDDVAELDAIEEFEELEGIPLQDFQLDIPIPMPRKVLCLAGNYAEHVAEGGGTPLRKEDTFPFFFMKPPTTTIRPSGSGVAIPRNSPDYIDWEVELTVVIGSYAKNVTPDEAADLIAGYTVGLDVSNRRLRLNPGRTEQSRTAFFEWLIGKWHDGFAPIGPCIVPADEQIDPTNLNITLAVNDEVMQSSNTSNMVFDVYEIVSYASQVMTLEPGDIIMTGTPSGVGSAKNRYLQIGDRVDATIEGIGTLTVTMT